MTLPLGSVDENPRGDFLPAHWTAGPRNKHFKAAPASLMSRVCRLGLCEGLRAAAMKSHKRGASDTLLSSVTVLQA